MRYSKLFGKTNKAAKEHASVNATLLQKGGFINQVMAGVYSYLPLGLRVLTKIENIVREEMNALGAHEVLLPALHPKENWVTTGRWDAEDAVLFKLESKHGYQAALGSTHEEIITPLVQQFAASYRDFPLGVYQIQTKFRDELRAKSGLLRGREFRMKDLYSFHVTNEDFEKYYELVAAAYHTIFSRLGLKSIYTEASGGSFSKFSHEFQVELTSGEDTIHICEQCGLAKNEEIFQAGVTCTSCGKSAFRSAAASEVGNIFPLKNKFSAPFGFTVTTAEGTRQEVLMGCYGLGTSRVMGVLVEKFHDEHGIIWPLSVAPYHVHLVAIKVSGDALYDELREQGIEVLYDDRESASAGEKFADADVLGTPWRAVVSAKTDDKIEVKRRGESEPQMMDTAAFIELVKTQLHGTD